MKFIFFLLSFTCLLCMHQKVWAQWSNNGGSLTTQDKVGLGTTNPSSNLHIQSGVDAGLSAHGYAVFGSLSYANLVFDNNEIMARNNGALSPLYLQNDGGDIIVHNNQGGGTRFVVKNNGFVGIGKKNPQTLLHLSSGSAGDAVLRLESDSDNNNEGDNARIELFQDAGSLGAYIGFNNNWPSSWDSGNLFHIGVRYSSNVTNNALVINTQNANVGIGTSNPTAKLAVNGITKTKEIIVTEQSEDWPDYVFEEGYKLLSLDQLSSFIKSHKRLPGLPSSEKISSNGQSVGVIQRTLVRKIEELTLYIIELKKENQALWEMIWQDKIRAGNKSNSRSRF